MRKLYNINYNKVMSDNSDNENNEFEFDNLLKHTGGKAFFESILGGIERQEINSSSSSNSSSSDEESSSESEDSISPLYADSSDSESVKDETSSLSSSETEESPLFGAAEETIEETIEETPQEELEENEESPLFETTGGENPTKKKTVADIKKIITDMTKLM